MECGNTLSLWKNTSMIPVSSRDEHSAMRVPTYESTRPQVNKEDSHVGREEARRTTLCISGLSKTCPVSYLYMHQTARRSARQRQEHIS